MATKTKNKDEKNVDAGQVDINHDSDSENFVEKSKNKKNKNKNKNKKGKKKIFIFLLLILIAVCVAVFVFNPFNVRDEYVYPALRNVPIIQNIIPAAENSEEDEFSGLTKEQLVVEYKKLQSTNKSLEEENETLKTKVSDSDKETVRLKEIEANQLTFRQEKEEFDRLIAANDPNAYANFYESINPENAEQIYREIVADQTADKELKQYVQTFENMKKDPAAKVLEEMISTDMDLVVRILSNISSEQRANILAAMESQNAAAAVKQMAPEEQQQ